MKKKKNGIRVKVKKHVVNESKYLISKLSGLQPEAKWNIIIKVEMTNNNVFF